MHWKSRNTLTVLFCVVKRVWLILRKLYMHSETQGEGVISKYSRVSFCDGSFYDDSLLRPLSSRTEHSRIAVHHCRNSSVLSLLSALLALFRCACVSSFSFIAVLLSWLRFFHPWRPSERQKRRKNQNSWRYIPSWCFLNHGLDLLQHNKKSLDWHFFSHLCYFL